MKFNPRDQRIRRERVMDALNDMKNGRLTRREFIRYASLMGATFAAAGIAGCAPEVVEQIVKETQLVKETQVVKETEIVEKIITATPEPTAVGGIKRGGKLSSNFNTDLTRFDDPHRISSYFQSNIVRCVAEYLVEVDHNMVLQPMLASAWLPSADGLDWTITLQEGVKFNNDKAFTADDVIFTFDRLLNPETSSGFSSIATYLQQGSVEKIDDSNVIFHCNRVVADFPYHLFSYMAPILPVGWGGNFYDEPVGTGPFMIDEFRPGEMIHMVANPNYWKAGLDGSPLPYVNELEFKAYPDTVAYLDALQANQITLSGVGFETLPIVMQMDNVKPTYYQSGGTWTMVLHGNEKPFDDIRVRQAFKLALDRNSWVRTVQMGYAIPGNDTPLAPIYDGLYDVLPTEQNLDQAKALLTDAGYPNGIDLTCQFINDWTTDHATWLAGEAEKAGFRITLQPNPEYWQVWLNDWGTNVMGVSNWGMRATPSEMLNIALRSTAAWNDSHWYNTDFDTMLDQYDSELDPTSRKEQLLTMVDLIREDCGMPTFGHYQPIYAKNVVLKDFKVNPIGFTNYSDCWLDI